MAYLPQSGGGRAAGFDTSEDLLLSKPYDLQGTLSPDQVQALNEMLENLYKLGARDAGRIDSINLAISNILSALAILQAGSGSAGLLFQASKSLTFTQLQTLNSAPVQIVPAPGAGLAIHVMSWTLEQTMGGTTFSAGPIMSPRYVGSSAPVCTELSISNSANRYLFSWAPINSSSLGAGVAPSNKAIMIAATADVSNGSGTFIATVNYTTVAAT